MLDPIIIHSIKQENTIPNGGAFSEDVPEDKTGVQRKTNMYMHDSMML